MRGASPSFLALISAGTLGLAGACEGGGSATAQPDAACDGCGADAASDSTVGDGASIDTGATPAPFGLDTRPKNATCVAPARPPSDAPVTFTQVFASTTFDTPLMLTQIPGDSTRFFVAQRGGTIVGFSATSPPTGAPTTIVTMKEPVVTDGEGGLLGLAFDPQFLDSTQPGFGRLYVSYTQTARVAGSTMYSTIARYTSTDGGKTFGDYTEIIGFDQDAATNHKGGSIAFDEDGYLYFGFGDGGGAGDTYMHGQDEDVFFGKVHRIDVHSTPPAGALYAIPDGNPYKSGGGLDTIYSTGMRNPFRFSFDRATNDLWVGDVGQDLYEEIDRMLAPGGNYGWPCREGLHPYAPDVGDPTRCPNPKGAYIDPVFEYPHAGSSKAIVGGVVYRGSAIPSMVGTYVFADEVTGSIWALRYDATGTATSTQLNASGPSGNWVDIAEDNDGELYVVDIAGKIYEMKAASTTADAGAAAPFPALLSQTGCVDPTAPQNAAPGLIPYVVNSPLWSDGAEKSRYLAIPDGTTIAVAADGHLDLPIGSVLMKTFSIGGARVETRLLVHHSDGGWAGYTYEWNDAQTDATLLPASATKTIGAQTWYFPSRSDCLTCHSSAADRTLGMELGQLNGDETYVSTGRISNQLATLDHLGMFTTPLTTPVASIVAYPTPTLPGAVDLRARAYLHANCSFCHRPDGIGGGPMDLRYATAFSSVGACGVTPDNGDLGVAGALLLDPGDPGKSLLSLRPRALDANRMPPLASHVVDTAGLAVVDEWITGVASCPTAMGDAGGE